MSASTTQEERILDQIGGKIASYISVSDVLAYLAEYSTENKYSDLNRAPERAGMEDEEKARKVVTNSVVKSVPEVDDRNEIDPTSSGYFGIKSIILISLKPSIFAFDFFKDGMMSILDRIPLLSLLQWSNGKIKGGFMLAQKAANFPLTFGKHMIRMVIISIEALIRVACDVWSEIRSLDVKTLYQTLVSILSQNDSNLNPSNSSFQTYSEGTSNPFSLSSANYLNDNFINNLSGSIDTSGSSDSIFGVPSDEEQVRYDSAILQKQNELRKKLDIVNRTAKLIAYKEKSVRKGSKSGAHISKYRVERVRRMMHYEVPLKPFQATVQVDPNSICPLPESKESSPSLVDFRSIFNLCTPQSFPPTPISRACVMSRTTQISDDVLFLARDHLRLDEQVRAFDSDETTRLTAEFLKSQARLAVLNGCAAAEGIILTCGHHCASKINTSQLYSSVRAMVPVLRNRFVFFQFSLTARESVVPSLSLGLSTQDMPLNTLVGTWAHSIGLSSLGQILLASRWYSCVAGRGDYGVGGIVGILVYLDGSASCHTWDGEMVTAYITYSVNGQPIKTTKRDNSIDDRIISENSSNEFHLLSEGFSASTMALSVPRDRDLFPTLTLHSPNIQVFCRFCASDMVHITREKIGAPPEVTVYALDGSVVLPRQISS